MKRQFWAVWGYDDMYCGQHGMRLTAICEGTEQEAKEYAKELAGDVIGSYSCIYESLEDAVQSSCEDQDIPFGFNTSEEAEIREQIYEEDMIYGYVELDTKKLPSLDIGELEALYMKDEEDFIEQYRIK